MTYRSPQLHRYAVGADEGAGRNQVPDLVGRKSVPDAGGRVVMDAPVEAGPVVAPRQQRERVIPLRKSDIIDGLVAEGRLDKADQEKFSQLARMLGAILHYEYAAELDRLRETYFYFDPEVDPREFGSAKV